MTKVGFVLAGMATGVAFVLACGQGKNSHASVADCPQGWVVSYYEAGNAQFTSFSAGEEPFAATMNGTTHQLFTRKCK